MSGYQLILKTRLGLSWETVPYLQLIQAICEQNWDNRDLTKFTEKEIADLLTAVYAKWGYGRVGYYKAMQNFFDKFQIDTKEDCRLFRKNKEVIPPDLKLLKNYVERLLSVLQSSEFEKETNKYKNEQDYMPDIETRRKIVADMKVDLSSDKAQRKLYKMLKEHKSDIIKMLNINAPQTNTNTRPRRVTNVEKDAEKKRLLNIIEKKIINCQEEGFEKKLIDPTKGWGVFSTREFAAKEFLLEYSGKLITHAEGVAAHERYGQNSEIGCYIFNFNFGVVRYSVDATEETGRLGRLVNHSRLKPNCKPQAVYLAGQPRLILVATRAINPGEEIVYDYGERSPKAIKYHPWLKNS